MMYIATRDCIVKVTQVGANLVVHVWDSETSQKDLQSIYSPHFISETVIYPDGKSATTGNMYKPDNTGCPCAPLGCQPYDLMTAGRKPVFPEPESPELGD